MKLCGLNVDEMSSDMSGDTTALLSRARSRDGATDSAAASASLPANDSAALGCAFTARREVEGRIVSHRRDVAADELRHEVTSSFGELLGEYDEKMHRG